jgi:trans-2,3-dihydro-3-hydroxyanthranilate isomerase
MTRYEFVQVDVFTDRPFGGNPLAVFPDANGLTDDEMRALAREMNLSETTFVTPSEVAGADFRVRIFTPAGEIPFAGHPVIGTHWVLAYTGQVQVRTPVTHVHFELGVGVLPADLYVVNDQVERVVMTQDRPTFYGILDDVTDLTEALGLEPGAISESGLPVQVVSTGLPQMMVPVRSLGDVARMDPRLFDLRLLNRVCRAVDAEVVLVFALETRDPKATTHVRAFAPLLGVTEDPATGSANGALGAYLVHQRVVPLGEGTTEFISEQGLEIGRPSTLYVEVDHTGERVTAVRVGGEVVRTIEGEVWL